MKTMITCPDTISQTIDLALKQGYGPDELKLVQVNEMPENVAVIWVHPTDYEKVHKALKEIWDGRNEKDRRGK